MTASSVPISNWNLGNGSGGGYGIASSYPDGYFGTLQTPTFPTVFYPPLPTTTTTMTTTGTLMTSAITTTDTQLLSHTTTQMIDGWVGQVKHKDRIIWESIPYKSAKRAEKAALRRIEAVLIELFDEI